LDRTSQRTNSVQIGYTLLYITQGVPTHSCSLNTTTFTAVQLALLCFVVTVNQRVKPIEHVRHHYYIQSHINVSKDGLFDVISNTGTSHVRFGHRPTPNNKATKHKTTLPA